MGSVPALIYKQIAKVMADIEAISKSRTNQHQGFKFRGIDEVYNVLHPKLVQHGLFSVPEVLEERREERTTKNGGISTHVILKIKYTLFAEDGSSISSIVIGEAADTGDKATNKAMSIAHKYFYIQTFSIPTEGDNDPDASIHEFEPRKAEAKKPASKATPKTAPAPQASAGDFRIESGTLAGKTIREVVERDGLPRIQEYVSKLQSYAERDGKPLSQWAVYLKVNLERYAQELASNHESSQEEFGHESFDTAADVARKVGGRK